MNRVPTAIALLSLLLACAYLAAAGTPHAPAQALTHAQRSKQTHTPTNRASDGEQRFRTHCGRCHIPPENLSAREARAVLRQMRVRAMLSAADEKLILEYIAP